MIRYHIMLSYHCYRLNVAADALKEKIHSLVPRFTVSDKAACLVMPNSDPDGPFLGYLTHKFSCRHLDFQHFIIKVKQSYFDVMVNKKYHTELRLNKANAFDTET